MPSWDRIHCVSPGNLLRFITVTTLDRVLNLGHSLSMGLGSCCKLLLWSPKGPCWAKEQWFLTGNKYW